MRLLRAESGAITNSDLSDCRTRLHCPVQDFDPAAHLGAKDHRRLSWVSQLAVVAAEAALVGAAGPCDHAAALLPERTGVVVGTATGGFVVAEPFFRNFYTPDRWR